MKGHSPILRIVLVVSVMVMSQGCDKLGLGKSPTEPTGPPTAGSTIYYTAVGASDANGVGSSVPCVPFDECTGGMGYVPVTSRSLKTQGFNVTVLNLGIPTAVIGRDFQTLGQQYNRIIAGNFIDQEMQFVQPNATLVTIFAGINEVNVVTAALGGGAGGIRSERLHGRTGPSVRRRLRDAACRIRTRAGSPRIVVLNVPNPAGLPYLAGTSLAQRQAGQRDCGGHDENRGQSTAVEQHRRCGSDVRLAQLHSRPTTRPTGCIPTMPATRTSRPRWSRRLRSASYPAPQNSCSAMTIVP